MSALPKDEYTTVEGKGSCPARASDEGLSSRPPDEDFHLAPTQLVEVMCECGRSDCTGEIMLSLKEYEAVRLHPTRFLLKEGHEVADVVRVVGYGDGHVVVENTNSTALEAVRTAFAADGEGGRG